MEEIPNNLGYIRFKTLANYRINYQPQLVRRIFPINRWMEEDQFLHGVAIEVVHRCCPRSGGNASAPLNGTAAPKKFRFEACPAQTTVQASQYKTVR